MKTKYLLLLLLIPNVSGFYSIIPWEGPFVVDSTINLAPLGASYNASHVGILYASSAAVYFATSTDGGTWVTDQVQTGTISLTYGTVEHFDNKWHITYRRTVGSTTTFYRTSVDGLTWTSEVSLGTSCGTTAYNGFLIKSNLEYYILCSTAVLRKTDDGGATWTTVSCTARVSGANGQTSTAKAFPIGDGNYHNFYQRQSDGTIRSLIGQGDACTDPGSGTAGPIGPFTDGQATPGECGGNVGNFVPTDSYDFNVLIYNCPIPDDVDPSNPCVASRVLGTIGNQDSFVDAGVRIAPDCGFGGNNLIKGNGLTKIWTDSTNLDGATNQPGVALSFNGGETWDFQNLLEWQIDETIGSQDDIPKGTISSTGTPFLFFRDTHDSNRLKVLIGVPPEVITTNEASEFDSGLLEFFGDLGFISAESQLFLVIFLVGLATIFGAIGLKWFNESRWKIWVIHGIAVSVGIFSAIVGIIPFYMMVLAGFLSSVFTQGVREFGNSISRFFRKPPSKKMKPEESPEKNEVDDSDGLEPDSEEPESEPEPEPEPESSESESPPEPESESDSVAPESVEPEGSD